MSDDENPSARLIYTARARMGYFYSRQPQGRRAIGRPHPRTTGWPNTPFGPMGDWVNQAACAEADPRLFDPAARRIGADPGGWGWDTRSRHDQAFEYCRRCPVTTQCAAEGVGKGGVWGGPVAAKFEPLPRPKPRHRLRTQRPPIPKLPKPPRPAVSAPESKLAPEPVHEHRFDLFQPMDHLVNGSFIAWRCRCGRVQGVDE